MWYSTSATIKAGKSNMVYISHCVLNTGMESVYWWACSKNKIMRILFSFKNRYFKIDPLKRRCFPYLASVRTFYRLVLFSTRSAELLEKFSTNFLWILWKLGVLLKLQFLKVGDCFHLCSLSYGPELGLLCVGSLWMSCKRFLCSSFMLTWPELRKALGHDIV